jgi:soluble lytic murein transglycosylase-like protein
MGASLREKPSASRQETSSPSPQRHNGLAAPLPAPPQNNVPAPPTPASAPARPLTRALKLLKKPHAEVQEWMARVQHDVAQARAQADGGSSGHTMVIMAAAMAEIREATEQRARRWRRRLFILAAVSVTAVVGLSGVIRFQQRRITALVTEKAELDTQIQRTLEAMDTETDEVKLAELEARLQTLMGSASEKVLEVSRASAKRGEELKMPIDPLEEEIRRILSSFNAETYAIPPIFKEALQRQVNDLSDSPSLRAAYARKLRYWPQIETALRNKQLPTELGYIAFTESGFDPQAHNPKSQASGMWQLMDETARNCGLTVSQKVDERYDPSRSSAGAACYLSKLMVEFGQESFMLTLASYNRGENGVRRALHRLAMQPGGYKKRDFWHLYRLKLLPEETREYVPKVLAAAIVLGNPQKYGLVHPN